MRKGRQDNLLVSYNNNESTTQLRGKAKHYIADHTPAKKRKTYQRTDDVIKTMVSRYGSDDLSIYLFVEHSCVLNIMSHKYDELNTMSH